MWKCVVVIDGCVEGVVCARGARVVKVGFVGRRRRRIVIVFD